MAKPWREVVQPHSNIRRGRLDESLFAADLADVKAGRGPAEYRDPEVFFKRTYLSQGLLELATAVLSRLAGRGQGEPVIQLQTPFGGGKTHSLLALYHIFTSGHKLLHLEAIQQLMDKAEVKKLPQVRVVTFVGTAADAEKGRTPWGELAAQLGKYDLLADHDRKRCAPGRELLHQLIQGQPTLILMDEIAEYAVKAKDFCGQLMAFLQELSETIKVEPQGALVVTLPSSAPYGEEGQRALEQLERIFGRVEAIYTPVEGDEMFEVIRRRLFENIGDYSTEARNTAYEYWELYAQLGEDVPAAVRETSYRERICRAYPFHPELIDLLFERWSTFPSFQRTRGALRLLANVVADLYQREHSAPLIQPAHVNLAQSHIQRELIKHIGNEFSGVIAGDIANANAKAQQLDRQMGSEYARFGIASGLATSIFLYSPPFRSGERQGASIQRLRVAVLREGVPPAVIGDALHRLEEELWYLHLENGLYHFTNLPNLNRIIIEKEEAVKDEDIEEEIKNRLTTAEQRQQQEVKVFVFPSKSADVPDSPELKLAVLSGEYVYGVRATEEFALDLLEHCGSTFRAHKNTLFVLAVDAEEFATLRRLVKRYLALNAIRKDKKFVDSLGETTRKELQEKWETTHRGLDFRLLSAYRHLAKAETSGSVKWRDLGIPTTGEASSLSGRVGRYLESQELILKSINPRVIIEKCLKKEEKEKPLQEIWTAFLKYPELPILKDSSALLKAVEKGVGEGLFGLRVGEQVYFKQQLPPKILDLDKDWETAVLLKPEVISKDEEKGEAEPKEEKKKDIIDIIEEPVTSEKEVFHTYHLRVRITWDKLTDFFRGVINPLRERGGELHIEIDLTAQSEKGLPKDCLQDPIKVTLDQIEAEILAETIDEN